MFFNEIIEVVKKYILKTDDHEPEEGEDLDKAECDNKFFKKLKYDSIDGSLVSSKEIYDEEMLQL